jgi:hypothetical protein
MKENQIQQDIRLRLSEMRAGLYLRYNVGTFLTMDGRPVKIGEPGVSDLIGITPHVVTEEDVGRTIGVFTALETKQVKDTTAKERKESQGNFLRRVNELGGLGAIVRAVADAENVVEKRWASDKFSIDR